MQKRILTVRKVAWGVLLILISFSANSQTADQIVEKHLEAIGGRPMLQSIRGIRQKRKTIIESAGVELQTMLAMYKPFRYRLDVEPSTVIPGSVEILNGEKGVKFSSNNPEELSNKKIEFLKEQLVDFPSPLMNRNITLIGEDEYNGKQCYILERDDKNRYWIDAESAMLHKGELTIFHEQVGEVKITVLYSDFRKSSGLMLPFAQEILEFNQRIELLEVEVNPKLPENYFDTTSSPVLWGKEKGKEPAIVEAPEKFESPEKLPQKRFEETGSYYAAVQEMLAAEDSYQNHPMFKGFYYEILATNMAIAGNTRQALKTMDKTGYAREEPAKPIDLEKNKPVNALDEIERQADKYQAIFINEAHHVPQHRAFTHQLLERLYKKGYRYFAAETLMSEDTGIIRQKDFISAYINEPEYADLIRAAVNIGYKIIAYEEVIEVPSHPEGEEPFNIMDFDEEEQKKRIAGREIAQATNLKQKIFDKDPDAKVLVHAGYDHIIEKQHGGYYMMAYRFREMTGLDPLTVDQVDMMERGSLATSNGHYQYIVNSLKLDEYKVLKKKNGSFWTTEARKGKMDMQVFHPKTSLRHGRPSWKALGGKRKLVSVKLDKPQKGIAEAFVKGEKNGVPIDRIYLDVATQELSFYLPKGEFEVRVSNEMGDLKFKKVISQ